MGSVSTCWCPLSCMVGDAVLFVRRDKCDGALSKAVTCSDTALARCIRPVPPDGSWRERTGTSWPSGRCEVNASPPDDGGGWSYHHRDGVATMDRLEIAHAHAHSLPCQCQVWAMVSRSCHPVWMSIERIGSSPAWEPRARYCFCVCSSKCPWRRIRRFSQGP
jgi:hypothetical protein